MARVNARSSLNCDAPCKVTDLGVSAAGRERHPERGDRRPDDDLVPSHLFSLIPGPRRGPPYSERR